MIYLFNAKKDADLLVKEWRNIFKLLPTKNEGEAEYQLNIESIQFSIGPDIPKSELEENHGIGIISLHLK